MFTISALSNGLPASLLCTPCMRGRRQALLCFINHTPHHSVRHSTFLEAALCTYRVVRALSPAWHSRLVQLKPATSALTRYSIASTLFPAVSGGLQRPWAIIITRLSSLCLDLLGIRVSGCTGSVFHAGVSSPRPAALLLAARCFCSSPPHAKISQYGSWTKGVCALPRVDFVRDRPLNEPRGSSPVRFILLHTTWRVEWWDSRACCRAHGTTGRHSAHYLSG